MLGNVLFSGRPILLSDGQTDLASQFIYWREFARNQLRQGHLPLWNPYLYCGTPFLGWAQAGVFYPTNWLDLCLPLTFSINLGIVLHVFLAGWFTFWWGLRRGLHPVAAVVAGALFMFCGPYFLHVYAGHLSLLYAIAWTPLVLASVDRWIQTQANGWLLLGMLAVALQIFAGDMQAVFYTAVAATLWLAFALFKAEQRPRILLGFGIAYIGAATLGAVQLLTTFQAVSESVRSHGISYRFASEISLAPENFLTLVAPGFFGDTGSVAYWGRWYYWEMCLFVGVTGLALAVYGSLRANRQQRSFLPALVAILLLLALGSNTPLFHLLYNWVPGFDRFRANAKFVTEASLFIALLAGAGLDHLLRARKQNKWFVIILLAAGILTGSAALGLRRAALASESTNWWSRAMRAVYDKHQSYLPESDYTNRASVSRAGVFASSALLIAAAKLLVLSSLLVATRVSRKALYAVALMAIAEVFVFGRTSLATFKLADTEAPKLKAFLDQRPGDYRIFYERIPNIAMWMGKEDVWGYGPLILQRYAEFMAFTEGRSPDEATQYLDFSQFHPLHAMLRWRYAFLPAERGDRILTAPSIMPRLQLISEYRVIRNRDAILQFMASRSFDPRRQVVLETQPDPAPAPSPTNGTAEVIESSANQMTISADISAPAILLITDAYSKGWRARPLAGSVQHGYRVLPADYVLRAIPLSRGHHLIRLEYTPAAFRAGAWISIISIAGFVFALGCFWWGKCSQ